MKLRVAAAILAIVAVAVEIWIEIGMPGVGPDPGSILGDPYYRDMLIRQARPFALAAGALGLLVAIAAGTRRARGRFARLGLWLVLIGAASALAFVGDLAWFEAAVSAAPRRVADFDSAGYHYHILATAIISIGTLAGLAAGAFLWIASYWLDRPRAPD